MNRKSSFIISSKKGSVLVVSLSMVATMGILSVSLVSYAMMEVRAVEEFERRMVAFHLADGAVDTTMVQIKADASYSGLSTTSNSYGSYSSTVCSSSHTASCPDPSNPPASGYYRIVASGSAVNTNSVGVAQTEALTAVVQRAQIQSEFDFGIFADGAVTLNGNAYTDSYNSDDGAYSAGSAGDNGDVGTNATAAGSISLVGNAVINGDAAVGESGDPLVGITTTGNAAVNGDSTALGQAIALNSPSLPGGLASSGQLKATGNTTRNVAGGTYWYDSIQSTGNGVINFSGPTVLYVTGDVQIAGNGLGSAGQKPGDLVIYVVGSGSVSVSGNGNFYCSIYAPDSAVSVNGNGKIFGSVIGDTIDLNGNAEIHYDEALGSGEGGAEATANLISWTDRL